MVKVPRKSTTERRKDIVKATLDLIGEKGIESLRTSKIADRVGFSEAALYRHFSTKQEVIKTTIQTAGEDLIKSLKKVARGAKTENELEKLREVLEAHLDFIQENPGITRLLFSDEVHFNREDLRTKLLDIINGYQTVIEKLIERGIEKGQIKEDIDIEGATTFYLGLIQTQILFWSLSGGEKTLNDQMDPLWSLFRELLEAGG